MFRTDFTDIHIVTTDKFGFTHSFNYPFLSGSELRRKIDKARAEQCYNISYKDCTGKQHNINKKDCDCDD